MLEDSADISLAQLFCDIRDPALGLLGYLAIDRTIHGKSCGGIRWGPAVSSQEVRALSYDMSLKYGFCNIAFGGAKAGIVAPFDLPAVQRRQRLEAFGRILGPLLRAKAYIPGADLGTTEEDRITVLQAAGVPFPNNRQGGRTSYHTAYGLVQAVVLALRHLQLQVKGSRVALDGFGKVGKAAAQLMSGLGLRVVAVSTRQGALHNPQGLPVDCLVEAQESRGPDWIEHYRGADRIPPEQLYRLPAEVLIPCGSPWVIHDDNVGGIQAKAVVPGANIPASRAVQEEMTRRGVLYLPDFICNCGGVLGNTLKWRGLGPQAIERFFREVFVRKLEKVLRDSASMGKSPSWVAERLALANLDRMERRWLGRRKSVAGRVGEVLRQPHRALHYAASAYYRKRWPGRRLVGRWGWVETARLFLEDPSEK